MRQIVLDTETTGLEVRLGHRVIEVGCIEIIDRKLTGNNKHFYLNPERDSDEGALAVHGLTTSFLETKPLFREIAKELLAYLSGAELVIHTAPFDVGFLDHEFRHSVPRFTNLASLCTITDSLLLARKLHPGQRNSLDALCKRYTVNNSHRELHGALLDAEILAEVFLRMTGGQSSLFAESNERETTEGRAVATPQKIKRPERLKVIRATEEELNADAAYFN